MSDLNAILADLAAGRIDAAEAARRIDAIKSADAAPAASTQRVEAPETPDAAPTAIDDEWGRPQSATHTRETFRRDDSASSSADDAGASNDTSGEAKASSSSEKPQSSGPVDPDDIPDSGPASSGSRPSGSKGVERISIRAVGRRVRVIGDRGVATLSAEGPHVLRRTGRTIEVTSDGEIGPSLDGFSIVRPPRSVEDLRTLGMGKELLVRVHPDIAVDVEVTAGSLHCSKVPVLGKVRVTAGGATLEDVIETADVLVQAGSATVKGDLKQGRSRVKVESGSLSVQLGPEANVTIVGDAQMGRIAWPGEHGQVHEYVVGNGSARLDIGVVMGYASVKVADHETSEGPSPRNH